MIKAAAKSLFSCTACLKTTGRFVFMRCVGSDRTEDLWVFLGHKRGSSPKMDMLCLSLTIDTRKLDMIVFITYNGDFKDGYVVFI